MMKKVLFPILFCLLHSSCYASKQQINNDLYFIKNRKISYHVGRGQIDTSFWSPHLLIVVCDLTEKQYSKAKQITPQTWLSLLENEKTDFAADVILNSIHHKGGPMFYVLQDFRPEKCIKIWKKFDKADEIQYWKRYFEKQDSINQVKNNIYHYTPP